MGGVSDKDEWELEVSSPFLKKLAWILVVLVMAVHIFMAIVVAVGDTGVTVSSADRWGFIGIGLVFSFVALSLLRPHVKVNSQGVEVRNIVNGQFYPWEIIHGLSFPQEAKWARLELPDFEFVPMMALNIYDKQLIAQRVEDFRQLEDRYMPFDE
nr:PH domain-containing protein [Corynebacterium sp. LK28]